MKCIVAGGAGFIGSNLVNKLLNLGYDVLVIDNESSDAHEHPYWNDNAKNYKLDILDYSSIKPLFSGVDWVFHLAAEARIQPAIENPIHATHVNVTGTCNILQASRENNVKRVVFSSTSAIYGLTKQIPNHENLPIDCLNPYSTSKNAGEELCKMYYKLFGLETVILRYFNVYGNHQPIRGQYAPVIGVFFRQVASGEPLTIVGTGERKRDYICVDDIVNANLSAAKSNHGIGDIYNIGTGVNYSVNDVAKMISTNTTHIPDRIGEAEATLADISKVKNILNWKPTISLEKWIKENHPLNKS